MAETRTESHNILFELLNDEAIDHISYLYSWLGFAGIKSSLRLAIRRLTSGDV
jgi:hypothetical protein